MKEPYEKPTMRELTKAERNKLIKAALTPYRNKNIYCPALKQNILITKDGIEETAWRAAPHVNATILAINFREVIQNAVYVVCGQPSNRKRQQKMQLVKMHILISKVGTYGTAKLTVGEVKENGKLLYCITSIEKGC